MSWTSARPAPFRLWAEGRGGSAAGARRERAAGLRSASLERVAGQFRCGSRKRLSEVALLGWRDRGRWAPDGEEAAPSTGLPSNPTAAAGPAPTPAADARHLARAGPGRRRARRPRTTEAPNDDARLDAFLRAEALDVAAAALPASSRVDAARSVSASLRYLRDRVGVPRDMSLPAARQFRAHLNWVADAVLRLALAEEGGQV